MDDRDFGVQINPIAISKNNITGYGKSSLCLFLGHFRPIWGFEKTSAILSHKAYILSQINNMELLKI